MKKLAMIVAAAENEVIGVNGDLPWQISADLKRFKRLTMGHHIIMGRKTYDSIGRLLPGRTTVIITRQADFVCEGGLVANSIEEAIALCAKDDLPFITGGAEIYRLALPFVNEIHLTRVHTKVDGDTKLPEIDWDDWTLVEEQHFQQDEKNNFDYSFQTLARS
ncbi:MAG: dihydrofolate reductase [Pirellulales bacterium]|jgi:dihydrofolate reductase